MTVIFQKREWYLLCSCGWCVDEFNYALMEGKCSAQLMGIIVMFCGILQMWAGGVAYQVSSGQDIGMGAWWSGMIVFVSGIFGLIRTFQCFPWLRVAALVLCAISVILSLAGIIVDGVAYAEVITVETCVNQDFQPYGTFEEDYVLSAALCQVERKRTRLGLGGIEKVPYECGCVKKSSSISFPSSDWDCSRTFPYNDNCEFQMILDPTLTACTLNVPADNTHFGANSSGWQATDTFCALKNNISSGVMNGCQCTENDYMTDMFNGDVRPSGAYCMMYSLNDDIYNCAQITESLPRKLEASVATGTICLLISILYLLVLVRVSLCPGCCSRRPKAIMPITGQGKDGKFMEEVVTKEEKALQHAMMVAGYKAKYQIQETSDLDHINRNKAEKKEATPMYMAWYKFAADQPGKPSHV